METNALGVAPRDRRQSHEGQQGQALIAVVGAMSVILLLLTAALTMTQYSGKAVAQQLSYQGQALNAAQAGLVDSLSWYRRQGGVVTAFDPKVNALVTPPINDSERPAAGIQRTFEMSDTFNLSGRYRVARTAVTDISVQKGKSGVGTVWLLESVGCVVFSTYSADNGCNKVAVTTGRIIARETVRAEIQRLNLTVPGNAAVYARRGDGVNITGGSRVQGGEDGDGLVYPLNTGNPIAADPLLVFPKTVDPDWAPGPPEVNKPPIKLQDIFGVTEQEVLSMADVNVSSVAGLPKPLPDMNLVIIRGNAVFDASFPLVGSGILIVFGDLTIAAGTNASYSGVIYVTGDFTMSQPALISGAVIAAGNANPAVAGTGGRVTISSSGDIAEVDFDQDMINQIQAQMGNYRFSRSPYIVGKEGN